MLKCVYNSFILQYSITHLGTGKKFILPEKTVIGLTLKSRIFCYIPDNESKMDILGCTPSLIQTHKNHIGIEGGE